jgi:hypothetical protein
MTVPGSPGASTEAPGDNGLVTPGLAREPPPQVNVAGDGHVRMHVAGLSVCAYTCYNLTGGEGGLAADWT